MTFYAHDNISMIDDFSPYNLKDIIYDRDKMMAFKIQGDRNKKYCMSVSEEDNILYRRFIDEITSYEGIIQEIENLPNIEIIQHNKNFILTEEQINSLKLLKEMV